jgi:hypothetical protein
VKASRRGILGMLAASPIAGRAMAQDAAAQLSKIGIGQAANVLNISAGQGIGTQGMLGGGKPKMPDYKKLLQSPLLRGEFESILFERERSVGSIDPDIACLRSFSLNAKIAFQRQRNVSREIHNLQTENIWRRMDAFMSKLMGLGS